MGRRINHNWVLITPEYAVGAALLIFRAEDQQASPLVTQCDALRRLRLSGNETLFSLASWFYVVLDGLPFIFAGREEPHGSRLEFWTRSLQHQAVPDGLLQVRQATNGRVRHEPDSLFSE